MPLPKAFDGTKSFAEFEAQAAKDAAAGEPLHALEVTSGGAKFFDLHSDVVEEDEGGDEGEADNEDEDADGEVTDGEDGEDEGEGKEAETKSEKDTKKPDAEDDEDAETRGKPDSELSNEQRFKRQAARMRRKFQKEREARIEAEREAAEARAARAAGADDDDGEDEQPAPAKKPAKAATGDDETPPDPKNYKFDEVDSEYIRDLARFHARQEFKAQRQAEEQAEAVRRQETERTTLRSKFVALIAKGAQEYDDFEKVVVEESASYKLSKDFFQLAVEDKNGHKILHHLATNKSEAERIAALTPAQQGVEFSKLSSRFSPPKSEKSDVADPPRQTTSTKASRPISRARGAGKPRKNVERMSFAEFEAQMASEAGSRK